MNRLPVTCFFLVGLLCASTAPADQTLPAGPSRDWNDKEIRQILENSPWAHRVPLLLVKPDAASQACTDRTGPCLRDEPFHEPVAEGTTTTETTVAVASTEGSTSALTKSRRDHSGRPGDSDAAEANEAVTGVAVVRWASARTIREALAGLVPPSGKRMDPQEISQLAPADAYVVYADLRVAVGEVSRVPQNGILTQEIAGRSFLTLRSSGQKIPAVRVAPAPLPEYDDRKELALAAYYIFFPKQVDGHPSIPQREKEVRFDCPIVPVPLHVEFKLSRMARNGAPDL